jgi:hypothetical protein
MMIRRRSDGDSHCCCLFCSSLRFVFLQTKLPSLVSRYEIRDCKNGNSVFINVREQVNLNFALACGWCFLISMPDLLSTSSCGHVALAEHQKHIGDAERTEQRENEFRDRGVVFR